MNDFKYIIAGWVLGILTSAMTLILLKVIIFYVNLYI